MEQFLDFHLEDNVKVWVDGIDKPPLTQVYRRMGDPKAGSTMGPVTATN